MRAPMVLLAAAIALAIAVGMSTSTALAACPPGTSDPAYCTPDPPTVTITTPPDGEVYPLNANVAADYACAEGANGPGLQPCVGTVADGARIDTSTLGPHTFTVTATSKSGLTASKTHRYTVARVRVKEVDFDERNVTQDRSGAAARRIGDFPAACPVPRDDIEWKDCVPAFPNGRPEKSWPVVAVRGSKLELDHVLIAVSPGARLKKATITGTATVRGRTLKWKTRAPVDENGGVLDTGRMVSDRALPGTVTHVNDMTIRWRVSVGGRVLDAGPSGHPLYVVYDTPTATVYLSLVDLTTRAANGRGTEGSVVSGIWRDFKGRAIHPRSLDPATGAVTVNAGVLQYWTPWTLLDDYIALGGALVCGPNAGTAGILRTSVGRCGSWAQLFADTLGLHGIHAADHGVDDYAGFPKGPAGSEMMLIKSWTFGRAGGAGAFPYRTEIVIPAVGAWAYGALREVDDAPGVPGQGSAVVPNPPGWFSVGDHAVDTYNGKIYDPSYGTGPFNTIRAWAKASLAGYATLDNVVFGPGAPGGARVVWTIRAHKGVP